MAGEAEGSGLGLAIVKEIAEQHKGRVWLEPAIKKARPSCVHFKASLDNLSCPSLLTMLESAD